MHGISYNFAQKSDLNIEKSIGAYIKEMRIRQGKTQGEVSKAADISRSTLSLLENGESGSLSNLIKVLRVIDQLHVLSIFEIKKQVSPLSLAKEDQKKRYRASKKSKKSITKSDW